MLKGNDDDSDAHGTGPEVEPEQPTAAAKVGGWVKELLIVVVLGLVVSTLLRTFVFQMFEIPSGSMEDTLQVGDRVAVQKITPFARGDVVVFEDPGGWLPEMGPVERTPLQRGLEFVGLLPNSSDQYLIKRVIGMPGDVVICCDVEGRLLVNGHPLEEGDYLYREGGMTVAPSEIAFRVTVPEGRIFVMGDHRNSSADSRCHLNDVSVDGSRGENAFVPTENVVGVAFAITFPFSRFQTLSRPATFEQVPAPEGPAPAKPTIDPAGVSC
ncbi:signal peptidase I [Propionibacteriaceae bacterium Y2011]